MREKAKWLLAIGLILFSIVYYSARKQVDGYRSDYNHQLHVAALPLPPVVIEALAGEFKGLVADYLLLEAASYIGSRQSFSADSDDWDAVAHLLDQSSRLDPYFRQTYLLAQAALPWRAQKYHEAIAILERSKRHLPWDWVPGFYIGFDYYFFLNDNVTASQKLMEASQIDDAPLTLATLASRLASKAGQTRAAIDFLSSVYENTTDEQAKKLLVERITALKGVQVLQAAVEKFKLKFGRLPHNLEELVEKSLLSSIPQNPYGRPYELKEGIVEF